MRVFISFSILEEAKSPHNPTPEPRHRRYDSRVVARPTALAPWLSLRMCTKYPLITADGDDDDRKHYCLNKTIGEIFHIHIGWKCYENKPRHLIQKHYAGNVTANNANNVEKGCEQGKLMSAAVILGWLRYRNGSIRMVCRRRPARKCAGYRSRLWWRNQLWPYHNGRRTGPIPWSGKGKPVPSPPPHRNLIRAWYDWRPKTMPVNKLRAWIIVVELAPYNKFCWITLDNCLGWRFF